MGTYEVYNNYIDVIAQFSKDGSIMPIKIRMADEDGELHNFMIKGYKELARRDGADWLGERRFLTKLEIFGVTRTVILNYSGKQGRWFLEKK